MMEPTCWVQITAGQGPDECALAVRHVLDRLTQEATQNGLATELLEAKPGNQAGTYFSVLLGLRGRTALDFVRNWQGTIQWVCASPYRPRHPRKNWFVGVDVLTPLEEKRSTAEKDLKFDTMRASGAGGQHVNTTDSAVRVVHLPTGLTTTASEERSQHLNKKLALARLKLLMDAQIREQKSAKAQEKWTKHTQLERGNPIRVFVGKAFADRKS